MDSLIDQSGLLVESDEVMLSTSLRLQNKALIDLITGASHSLHASAGKAIKLLQRNNNYQVWLSQATRLGLTKNNTDEILNFLNGIGGLVVKRTSKGKTSHLKMSVKLLFWGLKPESLARRYKVSTLNLVIAVSRSMLLLFWAVIVVAVLAYGAGFSLFFILRASLFFLILVHVTTFVHEASHAWIIGRNSVPMAILRRGLRIGILHRPMTPLAEYYSAILGPVAGILTAFSIGLISDIWLGTYSIYIGILVAFMHFLSWLPGYGDGNVIWKRTGIRKQANE